MAINFQYKFIVMKIMHRLLNMGLATGHYTHTHTHARTHTHTVLIINHRNR